MSCSSDTSVAAISAEDVCPTCNQRIVSSSDALSSNSASDSTKRKSSLVAAMDCCSNARFGRIFAIAAMIVLASEARFRRDLDLDSSLDGKHRAQFANFALSGKDIASREFATQAKKCLNTTDSEGLRQYSKSQDREDEILLRWFKNVCHGTYIEMGALDGVIFSNSYLFRKSELQWRGVLVELNERNYAELVVNRPDEIATVHAGVCDKKQKLHSVQSKDRLSAVGGIFEFAVPSFRQQWWQGTTLEEVRASNRVANVTEIECNTLDSILLEHARNVTFFDFFSLDVEGAELSVLRSIDFDRVGFGIIFVESDGHNQTKNLEVKNLLKSEGYHFWGDFERSYWFLNHELFSIYKGIWQESWTEHLHLPRL